MKNMIKNKGLIFVLLSGLILRLFNLTSSSIWHDEGYTMWLVRYNFWDIIVRDFRDVHPPGYYILTKIWVSIFGTSVFAVRFFSLIFSAGIIYLVYKIIKEIWDEQAAFWASLITAFSPFMIRFGQEARMYGVVAFFTTLGTYYLVKFLKEKENKYLIPYALSMTVAVYNQYYAFFVIIVHWIIMATFTPGFFSLNWIKAFKNRINLFNPYWWLATISVFALYLPWFPVAYRQVTRVSGSYWIKPEWITIRTIPGNVLQFITYNHLDDLFRWGILGQVFYWLLILVLVFGGIYIFKNQEKRKIAASLFVYGFLPMVLVFTLSKLKTPVYQDRYFPFSALGLFAVWGVLISMIKNKYWRYGLITLVIGTLLIGNYIIHNEVNHQMAQVKKTVELQKRPGDIVLSGELYTFLDGAYYLGYDGQIKLISEPVDGYGESSLFYDQQEKYIVTLEEAKKLGNRIFVIGKTGDKPYYKPENWEGWDSNIFFEENKPNGLKVVLYFR